MVVVPDWTGVEEELCGDEFEEEVSAAVVVVAAEEAALAADVVTDVVGLVVVELLGAEVVVFPNGSCAGPFRFECGCVDSTLSAGSDVGAGGGGVGAGIWATAAGCDDFDRSSGTATIATTSSAAIGQSFF
jgi:hypothetical protein